MFSVAKNQPIHQRCCQWITKTLPGNPLSREWQYSGDKFVATTDWLKNWGKKILLIGQQFFFNLLAWLSFLLLLYNYCLPISQFYSLIPPTLSLSLSLSLSRFVAQVVGLERLANRSVTFPLSTMHFETTVQVDSLSHSRSTHTHTPSLSSPHTLLYSLSLSLGICPFCFWNGNILEQNHFTSWCLHTSKLKMRVCGCECVCKCVCKWV